MHTLTAQNHSAKPSLLNRRKLTQNEPFLTPKRNHRLGFHINVRSKKKEREKKKTNCIHFKTC